eukprot:m.232977 g.232977  ORF g.232977 m.232977 type:complete len:155 (-) comp17079_c0_seq3:14-478(-)
MAIIQSVTHIVDLAIMRLPEDEWRAVCRNTRSVEKQLTAIPEAPHDFIRPMTLKTGTNSPSSIGMLKRVVLDKSKYDKRLGLWIGVPPDSAIGGAIVTNISAMGAAHAAGLKVILCSLLLACLWLCFEFSFVCFGGLTKCPFSAHHLLLPSFLY